MLGKRISELEAATRLTNDDQIPVVQGGKTKRFPVSLIKAIFHGLSFAVNSAGHLIETSDGTPTDLGNVKGERGERGVAGAKGDPGTDGKSAYEIAVSEGYVGTEEEWLASLKGEKGEKGEKGDPAYNDMEEITVQNKAYLTKRRGLYTREWKNADFAADAGVQFGGGSSTVKGFTRDIYIDASADGAKWYQRNDGSWAVQINVGTEIYIPVVNAGRIEVKMYSGANLSNEEGAERSVDTSSNYLLTFTFGSGQFVGVEGRLGQYVKLVCGANDYIQSIAYKYEEDYAFKTTDEGVEVLGDLKLNGQSVKSLGGGNAWTTIRHSGVDFNNGDTVEVIQDECATLIDIFEKSYNEKKPLMIGIWQDEVYGSGCEFAFAPVVDKAQSLSCICSDSLEAECNFVYFQNDESIYINGRIHSISGIFKATPRFEFYYLKNQKKLYMSWNAIDYTGSDEYEHGWGLYAKELAPSQ